MKNKRGPFYKTKVIVEILSEGEHVTEHWDLSAIERVITDGDMVGQVSIALPLEISAKAMAKQLVKFGSDPSFFNLDDEGKDVEES